MVGAILIFKLKQKLQLLPNTAFKANINFYETKRTDKTLESHLSNTQGV